MITKEFLNFDVVKTGENIKALLKKNNIKVKDLQEYLGLESEQSIYKWLRGDSVPRVDLLGSISFVLGVRIDDILVYRRDDDIER